MTAMAMPMDSAGHDRHNGAASVTTDPASSAAPRAVLQANPVMYGDGKMACSGASMEHCSAFGFDTLKLAAPPLMSHAERVAAPSAVIPAHGASGTAVRAPPDLLSVLSRLRI
ncbi:hypothetical protein JBE04_01620 [Streptomyces sp. PRKS01-29]|nr:hypothetical protein [Streptomyces sabulosicollis]MBI0293226.1 hypothetical protein [Streptomyces sabulosicollis]